jgi:hypothetical protein
MKAEIRDMGEISTEALVNELVYRGWELTERTRNRRKRAVLLEPR